MIPEIDQRLHEFFKLFSDWKYRLWSLRQRCGKIWASHTMSQHWKLWMWSPINAVYPPLCRTQKLESGMKMPNFTSKNGAINSWLRKAFLQGFVTFERAFHTFLQLFLQFRLKCHNTVRITDKQDVFEIFFRSIELNYLRPKNMESPRVSITLSLLLNPDRFISHWSKLPAESNLSVRTDQRVEILVLGYGSEHHNSEKFDDGICRDSSFPKRNSTSTYTKKKKK